MDFMKIIQERRSIRKFKGDAIPDEIVKDILEAARRSPSWANTQVWRFIVVKDKATKESLAETVGATNPAHQSFTEAPVVICIAAQRGVSGCYKGEARTDKGDYWFMFDCGIAMEHIVLAAWNFGLGTVHVGSFDAKKAEGVLKIPEGYSMVAMSPLGYFDEAPVERPRKSLDEIVFLDNFGNNLT